MKYNLYAMRDSATREFLSVTVDKNDDSAIRNFDYAVLNNPQLRFMPSDFALYKLGSYDSDSGKIESIPPEVIRLGTESEVAHAVQDDNE